MDILQASKALAMKTDEDHYPSWKTMERILITDV